MRAARGLATAAFAAALLAAGAAHAAGKPPVAVGVGEREFRLSPYRDSVRLGRVRFWVHNYGEDVHDLAVVGPHGKRLAASGEVLPGGDVALDVRFRRAGTYRLVCTRAGHAKLGMRARLVVRKRR